MGFSSKYFQSECGNLNNINTTTAATTTATTSYNNNYK